jgi:hypothetical protein
MYLHTRDEERRNETPAAYFCKDYYLLGGGACNAAYVDTGTEAVNNDNVITIERIERTT